MGNRHRCQRERDVDIFGLVLTLPLSMQGSYSPGKPGKVLDFIFVLENLEKSWNFPKIVWNFKKSHGKFCVHIDMYMHMYSNMPHVHGADWRGVRGCAATVLRPQAIIFRISHVR